VAYSTVDEEEQAANGGNSTIAATATGRRTRRLRLPMRLQRFTRLPPWLTRHLLRPNCGDLKFGIRVIGSTGSMIVFVAPQPNVPGNTPPSISKFCPVM